MHHYCSKIQDLTGAPGDASDTETSGPAIWHLGVAAPSDRLGWCWKRKPRPQAVGAHRGLFPHALRPHPLLHVSKVQGGVQATETLEEGFAPWRDLMGYTGMNHEGEG